MRIVSFFAVVFSSLGFGSGVGGYMSACYTGNFIANKVCQDVSQTQATRTGRKFEITLNLKASYRHAEGESGKFTHGNHVEVIVGLDFSDPSNFFDPEGKLPLLIRYIVHNRDHATVLSKPVVLKRVPNERKLIGKEKLSLSNNWGAKSVDTLEKVEILIPGHSDWLVFKELK